jgi:penicillin-binding protein 2
MSGIPLKDAFRETRLFHTRILVMAAAVAVLVLVLLARLVYLQVLNYEHFATLSRENRISIVPIPPVRGLIFDRNGTVLAENFPAYTLEIVPDQVKDMDALLTELGQLIELTPADLERFRRLVRQQPGFDGITLRSRLTEEEAARFAVNRYRLQGADLRARLQRRYPLGALGVHVLGYVGRISERDLRRIDKTAYRGTDYIGKLGIEAHYETELLGKAGYEQVETNAHGRVVRLLSRVAPQAGTNLYLNLDAKLQAVAESALGDRRGAVVALDARTGGVLAFVSTPTYDPNLFVRGIDQASYHALRDSPDRPLLNRALRGRYAPGSTIKGFLGLAALEYGRSASRTTFCPGYFTLPGSRHHYRCWRTYGHGAMNLHDAIVQSCDVYFYDLAAFLGIDRLHDFLSRFGFGQRTGIDLDGEVDGLVPSAEWKRRVRHQPWYPGETVIAGIGQGYLLVTPLQLAYATSALANRGHAMRPHLVYARENRAGGDPVVLAPQPGIDISLRSPRYWDAVIKAMVDVVHSDRGTARRLAVGTPYRIAGKTGTAQVIGVAQNERYDEETTAEHLRDHALFISFAPADDPKIAVAVVVENGGHGGSAAAPVAKAVLDYYLLGPQPDTQVAGTAAAPANTPEAGN